VKKRGVYELGGQVVQRSDRSDNSPLRVELECSRTRGGVPARAAPNPAGIPTPAIVPGALIRERTGPGPPALAGIAEGASVRARKLGRGDLTSSSFDRGDAEPARPLVRGTRFIVSRKSLDE